MPVRDDSRWQAAALPRLFSYAGPSDGAAIPYPNRCRTKKERASSQKEEAQFCSSKIPLWFETSPFRGKRVVDKTAEPMKSFSVTSPFREGQSARPLSVGCGVSRRTGRLWIETYRTGRLRCRASQGSYQGGGHVWPRCLVCCQSEKRLQGLCGRMT